MNEKNINNHKQLYFQFMENEDYPDCDCDFIISSIEKPLRIGT